MPTQSYAPAYDAIRPGAIMHLCVLGAIRPKPRARSELCSCVAALYAQVLCTCPKRSIAPALRARPVPRACIAALCPYRCYAPEFWFLFLYIISLQKLPLPRSPSAILPRVALVVFLLPPSAVASAKVFRLDFESCFRERASMTAQGFPRTLFEFPQALPRRRCFRRASASFRAHRKTSFPDQELRSFCLAQYQKTLAHLCPGRYTRRRYAPVVLRMPMDCMG